MLWLMVVTLARAGACPDPGVVEVPSAWDPARVWIHEPGWFTPLTDPGSAPLRDATWGPETGLLMLERGGAVKAWPVQAMAFHHVANDEVGGEPVVVTY